MHKNFVTVSSLFLRNDFLFITFVTCLIVTVAFVRTQINRTVSIEFRYTKGVKAIDVSVIHSIKKDSLEQ